MDNIRARACAYYTIDWHREREGREQKMQESYDKKIGENVIPVIKMAG